ncbi:hypothetical protein DAPPUDRAFT_256696 [Daphnia pulex]|uniref:Uncharacterized protein n=1 Tax=Daphnia pulex TaxID=6669 RepID=E9HBX1_DAPPU|nr:hypothetical protein DAPPUDRAFT_256696 [Daphnia pulex]|eukprot:EFX70797.1 hypothetical protein DAPPUDRAFT_256696 [Daphnia pulex]
MSVNVAALFASTIVVAKRFANRIGALSIAGAKRFTNWIAALSITVTKCFAYRIMPPIIVTEWIVVRIALHIAVAN